jgi:hypothetical protein
MERFAIFVMFATEKVPAKVLGWLAIASLGGIGFLLVKGMWVYEPAAIAVFFFFAMGWLFQQKINE